VRLFRGAFHHLDLAGMRSRSKSLVRSHVSRIFRRNRSRIPADIACRRVSIVLSERSSRPLGWVEFYYRVAERGNEFRSNALAWERRGIDTVDRLTLLAMADFAGPKCEVNALFETDLEHAVVERALTNLQLRDLVEITSSGLRLCVNPDQLAYRADARSRPNLRLAQR
jgi:hypothetical protein